MTESQAAQLGSEAITDTYIRWSEFASLAQGAMHRLHDKTRNTDNDWCELPSSELGPTYWYNKRTQQSQWERPTTDPETLDNIPALREYLTREFKKAGIPEHRDQQVQSDKQQQALTESTGEAHEAVIEAEETGMVGSQSADVGQPTALNEIPDGTAHGLTAYQQQVHNEHERRRRREQEDRFWSVITQSTLNLSHRQLRVLKERCDWHDGWGELVKSLPELLQQSYQGTVHANKSDEESSSSGSSSSSSSSDDDDDDAQVATLSADVVASLRKAVEWCQLPAESILQSLDLWNNKLLSRGAKLLAEAVATNCTLQTLNLSKNHIGEHGARHLGHALKRNTSLHTLELWDSHIKARGARYLAAALHTNTALTSLGLRENDVGITTDVRDGNVGAETELGAMLEVNTTLLTLDLWGNKICDEGAGLLADALTVNDALTSLNIRYNHVEKDGAEAFAAALKQNLVLQTLDLWGNKVGGEGAALLADALHHNRSLTDLNLRGNEIDDKGAEQMATALQVNRGLTTLDLSSNLITDKSVRTISTAICGSRMHEERPLTVFKMRGNQLSEERKAELELAKQDNPTLIHLDVR